MSTLSLMPHQQTTVEYCDKNKYVVVALEMGLGKAQPLNSEVQTPEGPVPIGSIKVGDFVVGVDGLPKAVRGVFPQGVKKSYKVYFNDGSSCECCEDHLWSVKTANDVHRGGDFRVLPLKHIAKKLKQSNGNRIWSIPQCSPVEYVKKSLPISPYVFGLILGDGSVNGGSFHISNTSEQILRNVQEIYPQSYRTISGDIVPYIPGGREENILRKIFKERFVSCLSKNKRIPLEYMYTCVEHRVSLLRGLMDTDGYISEDGHTSYTTASEGLAKDVESLVKSLGGISKIRYKKSKCQTGEFDSWNVLVSLLPEVDYVSKAFKLDRKPKKSKYPPRRYIDRIEFSRECETVCISVEGDHYLTNNYIVTHNTTCALELAHQRGGRLLVVCPSYLILNWKKEVNKFYPGKSVTTFKTSKDVYKVWDTDIVIISYDMLKVADCLFEWANIVVADEANYLKNVKAKRTDSFHRMIYENSTEYLLLLTGTPIKNRVEEYYSLLALMNYRPGGSGDFLEKFPDSITFADTFSYRQEYTMYNGWKEITVLKWSGIQRVDLLKSYLKGKYIRFEAKDVLDLKEPIFKEAHISEADDLELMNVFKNYEDEESGVSPEYKKKAAIDKVAFTIRYVEGLFEDGVEEIVIFSDHVEPCERIASHFKVKPIHGKVTKDERHKISEDFQSGKIKVISATIGSFSTGVTLTKSSHLVFNDFSWVPGDIDQAIRRILRIGQDKQCYVHSMFGSPQDYYIWEALLDKRKTIKELV